MWKRIVRWWNLYKNVAAFRGLLQWLNWWNAGAATVSGVASAIWAHLQLQPASTQLVDGLVTFAAILVVWHLGIKIVTAITSRTKRNDLTNCPKVLLSQGPRDIDLTVEALDTDAANIQLVPIASKNYKLRSEVIRCLKKGEKQSLILRCEPRDNPGERWSETFLFFDDQYPEITATDLAERFQAGLMRLTEQQITVNCEIAYSTVSIGEHFRSAFKLRYENYFNSIVDSEPTGIWRDAKPLPAAPANVVRVLSTSGARK